MILKKFARLYSMQLETKLKKLDLNDPDQISFMYKVRTHPKVNFFLSGSPPKNYLSHVNYLFNAIHKNKNFFIIFKGNSTCGYCQTTVLEDYIEIGCAIHPDWWSKGIGTDAVGLLINETRNYASGKKLMLIVKSNNIAAIKIYKKYEFKIVSENKSKNEYLMELNGKY